MKINLSELEQKAKAATPGGWLHVNHGDYIELDPEDDYHLDGPRCMGTQDKNRTNNAAFIASMNPTTALALIRVARAAQAFIKEYQELLDERVVSTTVESGLEKALKEIE